MRDDPVVTQRSTDLEAPGHGLDYGKMPGHWLLAQMGKRVLRPGGVELTSRMLEALDICSTDEVVEFAPGLGLTARAALERQPASYTGIERDETASRQVGKYLKGPGRQCLVGRAEATGLPDASATVVFGEAMLSMQTPILKASIVEEAARLLRPGGRYGVHELCLQPDDLEDAKKSEISRVLSDAIRVGARPLTPGEWKALLEDHGFAVETQVTAPMHLMEPRRFIRDEGWARTIRFVLKVARTPAARRRILRMRAVFREYAGNLAAITLVGVKK
ncbi:MAG: class I SAM-dependent methyltransferase [Nitrospira sp. SB0662_bin_26]|nr:class I SAM-dependent methyltransferase [Nitrospira sp. SB0662_bin_26]